MPISSALVRWSAVLTATLAILGGAHAQTRISNTATLSYGTGSERRTVPSNTVTLNVRAPKQATSIGFRLVPTDYRLTGMTCDLTADGPRFTPAMLDQSVVARAPAVKSLDRMSPLIVVVEAPGANLDPAVRETTHVNVTAPERSFDLPVYETAPNSGVFAAGIPARGTSPDLRPCDVALARGAMLGVSYGETDDSTGSEAWQLVDPAGFVFDSATGEPVDGAVVSLVDAAGNPAQVFGEDGVSAYPSTVTSGTAVRDASGREYPAVPGRFWFPFSPPGTYRVVVRPPEGYSAPSTVDRETLARLRGPGGAPFIIADASFGGDLELVDDPVLFDIPVDKPRAPGLLLTKTASVREASAGDFIQYSIRVSNRGIAGSAPTIVDTLPPGLRYERGSTRGAAEPLVAADGRTLRFALPSLGAGAAADLRYVVTVSPDAPVGEALNRARAEAGAVASNEAAASVRLRAPLFTDALTIIGRVTEGRCGDPSSARRGVPGVRVLLEDGTFTLTDRDGLYHFEGVRPGRHVVQIDRGAIPPTHRPVACDADTRHAGNPTSRFVEGEGGLLKRVDFQLAPTGKGAAVPDALPVAADDAVAAGQRDWLDGQAPGIDWLFPAVDHNPRAPALRVVIKHGPEQRVALMVNGERTDPLNFDGTETRGEVAVSRWSGLAIGPGTNRLSARVLGRDGSVVRTLERDVRVSGPAVRAELAAAHSRLVADGLTRPVIALRVTDKDGRPVRAGTIVPFGIDDPYRAQEDATLEQGRRLAGQERRELFARVAGDDGLAFVALQPTTQAGAVRLTVSLAEERQTRVSEVRAWLAGRAQDWVVVGFGAGTIGHDTLGTHARALPRGERDRVVTDGQLAFYAKGRIKGAWLLTMAYDSERRYDPDRGLLGVIDPDRYYTVYGDGSAQGYDAATRRKLYLRLERREAYALFGDFETGFADAELTRYSRTLNGVKAAYEGETVRAVAFAAGTSSRYGRDEIQGNGLSGPYRLSGRDIVPNSDKLRIEVRDRFRSELIHSARALARHIDYDIDTLTGTVRFREPVLSRDAGLNPIFIVAEYEVEGGRTGKLAAAGRVAARLADGRFEVGAAAIRDEAAGATIAGIDVRARVDRATAVRAETALGGPDGLSGADAFLAEVEHHGSAVDLLAYVRRQELGFGLGQQNLAEAGTRKLGLDGRAKLTDRLSLTGTGWHQRQLGGPARRIAGDARLEYRTDRGTLFLGGQMADDTGLDGGGRRSRLLTLGGSRALFDGALELIGQTQVAPGGDKDSVDFPVRHRLDAAWRVRPGVRLIGGYEVAEGQAFAARTARVGFDVAPWKGGKLLGTLNNQATGENGARSFAQYGLSQSLPLGRRWSVDATLDATSTIDGTIPAGAAVNAVQPIASGGSLGRDTLNQPFAAVTLGATYRADRWTWNGRVEFRDAGNNDRLGVTSNFLRTLGQGSTIASAVRAYRVADRGGATAASLTADLALAVRPLDRNWSVLERLTVRHERAGAGFDNNVLGVPAYRAGDQATTRVVNNLALNYRTGDEGRGHGFEATLYHGAKYVRGRYADDLYDGFLQVAGLELRRDLGTRFDLGVQASARHAWDRGAVAFSAGPSVGVSPARDVWVTAGFNVAGYRDRDFEADRYTRAGPYLTARLKFDQLSLRSLFGEKK